MIGMNAQTGEPIEGVAHLEQSIRDILTTPIGSRVMRRDYGSRVIGLVDRPLNASTIAEIQAAIAMALTTQEPRIRLTKIQVDLSNDDLGSNIDDAGQGKIAVRIEGYSATSNSLLTLGNITLP
ncbi:MAG TPA: phage baseplate protein [Chromatiaceae bacterium]|jgi:phage baseplate assembly protein W|nr:MAG: phage baseplate protein [Thiohalocapsa sp. PB-PSB1]HBG94704.1 phage baseplate protein [Chromatiaceae bacterium]HCS90218.1 phage baseplate protein [Chromatiaceae bacterium]